MVQAIRSLLLKSGKETHLKPILISPTDRARQALNPTLVPSGLRSTIRMKTMGVERNALAEDCSTAVFVDDLGESPLLKNQDHNKWADLVARIKACEHAGMEELYRVFHNGMRFYFWRQLGGVEVDDKIHDTFLIVVKAIQNGAIREPERLMGYVRTIARRQVAAAVANAIGTRRNQADFEHGLVVSDSKKNPEEEAIATEKGHLVAVALESLSPKDREILVRFYLREQSQAQICAEMSLTDTQFRLGKSRAKARLGVLGRKNVGRAEAASRYAFIRAS
jgi:RNA polymerase sigma-70 factor, ECF subfamily